MKHKTADLEGALLDAAVSRADGWAPDGMHYAYSREWEFGGPIIERERITVIASQDPRHSAPTWSATVGAFEHYIDSMLPLDPKYSDRDGYTGPTPLIAAMRAYVASKFGEDVELP